MALSSISCHTKVLVHSSEHRGKRHIAFLCATFIMDVPSAQEPAGWHWHQPCSSGALMSCWHGYQSGGIGIGHAQMLHFTSHWYRYQLGSNGIGHAQMVHFMCHQCGCQSGSTVIGHDYDLIQLTRSSQVWCMAQWLKCVFFFKWASYAALASAITMISPGSLDLMKHSISPKVFVPLSQGFCYCLWDAQCSEVVLQHFIPWPPGSTSFTSALHC